MIQKGVTAESQHFKLTLIDLIVFPDRGPRTAPPPPPSGLVSLLV